MRVALVTDSGNYAALEAVLSEPNLQTCDSFVFAGQILAGL